MKNIFKSLNSISVLNGVSAVEKLVFTKHLAIMIKSGIPLSEAMTIAQDQTKNSFFKKALKSIGADINNGQSLEKSLGKFPHIFELLYLSLISIGEKSGNLEVNLDYLSIQLKKSYEFNKKVQGALLYPEIVLGTTFLMGGSLSIFVLPSLVDLFHSLDVELPLTTKLLLGLATIMKGYGVYIRAGFVTLAISLYLAVQIKFIKPFWHHLLLTIPIIGPINQNIILASFCRDLGIMLKSGLTITSALESTGASINNLIFKGYVESWMKAVEKGKRLSEEMERPEYKLIPLIVPRMINVGENTGKLEETLIYLGDFFEEEIDDTTKNLSNILEPALLLGTGVIVAFVALAIISPVYQLTSGIKR